MDYLGQLVSTKLPVSTELTKQEKFLRTLDNCCNDVEDLSPIAALQNLRDLTLGHNLISDLSPLAGRKVMLS